MNKKETQRSTPSKSHHWINESQAIGSLFTDFDLLKKKLPSNISWPYLNHIIQSLKLTEDFIWQPLQIKPQSIINQYDIFLQTSDKWWMYKESRLNSVSFNGMSSSWMSWYCADYIMDSHDNPKRDKALHNSLLNLSNTKCIDLFCGEQDTSQECTKELSRYWIRDTLGVDLFATNNKIAYSQDVDDNNKKAK